MAGGINVKMNIYQPVWMSFITMGLASVGYMLLLRDSILLVVRSCR